MEELDGPSLEWDEEYALSESPPLQELQVLCCEDELQALKQEDLTETTEDQKIQEVTRSAEGESEATQDSGVETEELRRNSSLAHTTLPDDIIDKESQGENYKVNKSHTFNVVYQTRSLRHLMVSFMMKNLIRGDAFETS